MKMKFKNTKLLENIKCKLYRLVYPEVSEIFDLKVVNLEEFNNIRNEYLTEYKLYKKGFGELEYKYQELLFSVACFINELFPNPSLEEIFYSFCYLYRSGTLSSHKKFTFDYPDIEISVRQGLSVINNKAVCRNISHMLNDLLLYFGYNGISIMTDHVTQAPEENIIIEQFEKLTNNSSEKSTFTESFLSRTDELADLYGEEYRFKLGNHINTIIIDNTATLLDPTNIGIYKISTEPSSCYMKDYAKLWTCFASGEYTMKATITLFNYLKDKTLKLYPTTEILKIQKKCFDTLDQNKEKVLELHNHIKPNIQYIKDFLSQ